MNKNDNTLVQTIIALGHSLGMIMIAEGIETDEQLKMLRQFDCDEIQGFLLAKPMPAIECLSFIQVHEEQNKLSKIVNQLDSDANAS